MMREIGETCHNTRRRIPDCACRMISLMYDNPILLIFHSPGGCLRQPDVSWSEEYVKRVPG
jgi:hypothetical protein